MDPSISRMPLTTYSDAQKAQCVMWASNGHGPTAIRRFYQTKYGGASPSSTEISQWGTDYEERGTHAHRGGNGRPSISDAKKTQIKQLFHDNPKRSLRDVASEVHVHHTTVWALVRKELKMFPYRLQIAPQLSDADKTNRLAFAHLIKQKLQENPDFLKRIVYSDECSFSLGGAVKKQKVGVWGTKRPDIVYQSAQSTEYIMVWCVVSKTDIIGPYFFEDGTVTGERYKRMLRYFFFPKLRDYPEDMLFQQDGASSHYAVVTSEYFDMKLPNC